jgi:hypothetical protein
MWGPLPLPTAERILWLSSWITHCHHSEHVLDHSDHGFTVEEVLLTQPLENIQRSLFQKHKTFNLTL